jgi:hypothetical protein
MQEHIIIISKWFYGGTMRLAGKKKLGYFPLPAAEAERIRRFLNFPVSGCSAVDHCIGDGGAFKAIAGDPQVIRYGIELDAYRVEQARETAQHVIHGGALDVHCPVESLSLLYLNPPYDFECGQSQNRRLEQIFFEHCYRWLKPAGVLVLVVPRGSSLRLRTRSRLPLQEQESLSARLAGSCEVQAGRAVRRSTHAL